MEVDDRSLANQKILSTYYYNKEKDVMEIWNWKPPLLTFMGNLYRMSIFDYLFGTEPISHQMQNNT
jgi:hypothetical protein